MQRKKNVSEIVSNGITIAIIMIRYFLISQQFGMHTLTMQTKIPRSYLVTSFQLRTNLNFHSGGQNLFSRNWWVNVFDAKHDKCEIVNRFGQRNFIFHFVDICICFSLLFLCSWMHVRPMRWDGSIKSFEVCDRDENKVSEHEREKREEKKCNQIDAKWMYEQFFAMIT